MGTKLISVLLIDGDSASRNYLAALLKNNGYMVQAESFGREGLKSAWKDLPNAIIVDPVLSDLTGLELITRLRQDRRTATVRLIALSRRNDPQEMAALLTAGCNEYLVKSGQTIQKLLDLLAQIPREEQPSHKQGCAIVFLSAKGGTGTTSLCANIAMLLTNAIVDRKVAVMDLVLPLGSIAQIVGYDGKFNLVTAAFHGPIPITSAYLNDVLVRIPEWNFYLLAGAPNPESANRLSGERIGEIFNSMVEAYDFVFADLGRSLSRISLPIIKKAKIIVLIVSTDLATADLTRRVLQYLKAQSVDPKNIYVIQNRAVGLEGLMKADLEQMLGLAIGITIPYMGDSLTFANNHHQPLSLRSPNDSATFLLRQVATLIMEMDKQGIQ